MEDLGLSKYRSLSCGNGLKYREPLFRSKREVAREQDAQEPGHLAILVL